MFNKRSIFKILLTILASISFFINKPSTVIAEVLDVWSLTNSLPYSISGHSTLKFSSNIYVINGSSFIGSTHSDILSAVSQTNGQIDEWQSISNIYPPLIGSKAATHNSYGYIAGGLIDNINSVYSTIDTVRVSKFENGYLTQWLDTNKPLYEKLSEGGLTATNGNIYYLGGYRIDYYQGPEIPHASVVYARIDSDGSLNEWQQTTPLAANQPRYYFGVVETGKKILTIGGKYDSDHRFSRAVFQSDVDLNTGELGPWTETYPLPDNNGSYPTGYNSVGVIRAGDYIIAVGGAVCCGNQSKKVYYTKITQDGGIEPWQASQYDLPIRSAGGQVQYANGYLYYIGGYSNDISGGYHDRVYFTKLDIPTNTDTILNVPDLKQYSLPWGPLTYDHQTIQPPTMARWGCSTTSAAMILQYYGGSITPEELNNWLKDHNGYDKRAHNILWTSVTTFAKQDPNTHDLEFNYSDYSESLLKTEIENNRPAIVKMHNIPYKGVHFVTAKGSGNSNIYINDPAKTTNPTLADANTYWGGNISIGRFMPSNTDLSYIVLFFDENLDIKVYDPYNNEISSEFFHTEYPSLDPANPNFAPEGETLRSLYYPKPQDGIYKIEVDGKGDFQIDSYLYDVNGNSIVSTAKGNLVESETKTFFIDFDKNSPTTLIDESVMEIFNVLGDYSSENVYKRGIYNHIRNSLLNINTHILADQNSVASQLVALLQTYVDENKKAYIKGDFYSELSTELQSLYASTTLSSYIASGI